MTQQTLYPVANSVGPQQVRETDSAYIIEDVPIVRPMELAGGYVPEQSIRHTAEAWEGTTVTLNHPRDDRGRPVAANRKPETHLGETENARYDGSHVRGDIRLSKERLRAQGDGAEQIKHALRNGEKIDVSSQYAPVISQDTPASSAAWAIVSSRRRESGSRWSVCSVKETLPGLVGHFLQAVRRVVHQIGIKQ